MVMDAKMTTTTLRPKNIATSLESLRAAALRSRAKQRVPSLSRAAEGAFERDENYSVDERFRKSEDRTPSPATSNEAADSAIPLNNLLNPQMQASAVEALAELSRAGLSYHDLLSYGDIHPLFLSSLVSSVSLPPSSPATETSKVANTSFSSPAVKSDLAFGDEKFFSEEALNALLDLSAAGLLYQDIVQLGAINPLYLARLVSHLSPDSPRHTELLEQAVLTVNAANTNSPAVVVRPALSVPSSGTATPALVPSASTTPTGETRKNPFKVNLESEISASVFANPAPSSTVSLNTTNVASKVTSNAVPNARTQVSNVTSEPRTTRSKIISNGQNSVTISGNSVQVNRTIRKRPTAMELGGSSSQVVKFGTDRSVGKMVIEMSDSEDSEK
ncbi:hypothetical protein V1512DRAFT_260663 [Lipomyces arxii]|uniref:uncharacterized protein n=1 Tax=Lipomyces arxii TaxID=56418 RepID=UPI0034CE01F8